MRDASNYGFNEPPLVLLFVLVLIPAIIYLSYTATSSVHKYFIKESVKSECLK